MTKMETFVTKASNAYNYVKPDLDAKDAIIEELNNKFEDEETKGSELNYEIESLKLELRQKDEKITSYETKKLALECEKLELVNILQEYKEKEEQFKQQETCEKEMQTVEIIKVTKDQDSQTIHTTIKQSLSKKSSSDSKFSAKISDKVHDNNELDQKEMAECDFDMSMASKLNNMPHKLKKSQTSRNHMPALKRSVNLERKSDMSSSDHQLNVTSSVINLPQIDMKSFQSNNLFPDNSTYNPAPLLSRSGKSQTELKKVGKSTSIKKFIKNAVIRY